MLGFEGCGPQKGSSYLQRLWLNTLRMDFAGAFVELWLGMTSLELWLEMVGKHLVFLELWLGMADDTGVSVRVVPRTDGIDLIEQPWVVANGVANLVLRVRLLIRI
ncbi:hypothetical protein DEO72_LG7g1040 [Vigna unguiculata]|uniref:Uncharacterized protein n=1 Tax=Vigna unguiculata TaxID=3917 RepID=A0A4D6MEH0_VIGUN|nr:hypothetical protein DEO72_LG7g1040 [Vigna unguiculata]